MSIKMAFMAKLFKTDITLVRFLSLMDSKLVLIKIPFHDKLVRKDIALVGFLFLVDSTLVEI